MKDFLFIYFSFVNHVEYLFKSIENSGYSCDFVTQKNISSFTPTTSYKAVVCYLHEQPWVNDVNRIITHPLLQSAFFVQHDDTDFSNVMNYYVRVPQLIFHGTLTH